MKKLVLTSLMAVFAVSSANAANDVMNGNVLYRPEAGHFYSVTNLESNTDSTNVWGLTETFGYGITDRFSIEVAAAGEEGNWFDWQDNAIDGAAISANWRMLNKANWKADVFGTYTVAGIRFPDTVAFDKDITWYGWTVGAKAGYETVDYAIAAKVAYNYVNTESFNWDEKGATELTAGLEAWWKASDYWSLVAGFEYSKYMGYMPEELLVEMGKDGHWDVKFGANLNLDASHYVGAYLTKEVAKDQDEAGKWNIPDAWGFGLTFGVDF